MLTANLSGEKIHVYNAYPVKNVIKTIPGRKWNPKEKAWVLPVSIEAVETLDSLRCRFDPEIIAKYEEMKKRQEKITEIKTAQAVEPIEPIPIKSHIKAYQHQIKAYNLALQNPAFAYLMEMGTGKTLAALMVAARKFERGEIKKLLVVCPATVTDVWAAETDALSVPVNAQILTGQKEKRIERLGMVTEDKLNIAIINYEATWRIIDELLKWDADMVIADESQRIKTPGAKQSKAMHRLGKKAKYKLILTGTPVLNSPLDVFSQYKFLDDSIFGTSFYAFRNRYAIMGGYGGYEVIDYKNLDELKEKVHSIAYRVTKEEALDLPEQVDQILYCELEPKAQQIYDEIKEESYAKLATAGEVTVQNVLTEILRLQQVTGGYITTDTGVSEKISSAKINVLKDIITDTDKKLVIFARFLSEIKEIMGLLDELGIEYGWITGAQKKRSEEVRRFQEDPTCRVFIAQTQTAGLGITLTAADTAIFYSLDYSYANYDQAKARLHRIGQKNKCTYIHLIAKNTIDEKVLRALKEKKNIAEEILRRFQNE